MHRCSYYSTSNDGGGKKTIVVRLAILTYCSFKAEELTLPCSLPRQLRVLCRTDDENDTLDPDEVDALHRSPC